MTGLDLGLMKSSILYLRFVLLACIAIVILYDKFVSNVYQDQDQ